MIYCKSLNLALNAFCVNVSVCELSSRYIYVAENVTIASERHIPRYRSFQCRGTITRIKVIHAHISGKLCVLINWKSEFKRHKHKKNYSDFSWRYFLTLEVFIVWKSPRISQPVNSYLCDVTYIRIKLHLCEVQSNQIANVWYEDINFKRIFAKETIKCLFFSLSIKL